jgi:ubiquinone/menaquinone biosynthesis C-methylase UbiE
VPENTGAGQDRRAKVALEVAHPRQSVVAGIERLGLRPGMRVLDVGCGPGAHLGMLADGVAPDGQVTGIDVNAEDLAIARTLWPDAIAAGIVLREGNAHDLPFADNAFDAVWSSAVFHHLEQPDLALAEVVRVVGPGGVVGVLDADNSVSFPMLPWPPELEQRMRAAVARGDAEDYGGRLDHHFDGYLGRKLPRLMRESGLRDIELHVLADVDQSPLPAWREPQIRDWFLGSFLDRIGDYLAPADRERLSGLFAEGHPDNVLGSPTFFMVRTYYLVIGRAPE